MRKYVGQEVPGMVDRERRRGQVACRLVMRGLMGLEGLSRRGRQAWGPEDAGWTSIALKPMEDEGEQLLGPEVETRQPDFGLGVEVLGQLPEAMGTFHTVPLGVARDPVEMSWRRRVRQLAQRLDSHQAADQQIEQKHPCAVGEGHDPLTDGGADWAFPDQAFHQAVDTQSSQDVEGDDALHKRDHVMSVGMQEVGEQAVGAPAGLAADALDADAIGLQTCDRLSLVRAPADQSVGNSTVGMRTAVGKSKKTSWKRRGFGVVLGRMSVVLYNDHIGAPPLVVLSAKIRPLREAFSFLASLFRDPIVLPFAILVNLGSEVAWSASHAASSPLPSSSTIVTALHPALQALHSIRPQSISF